MIATYSLYNLADTQYYATQLAHYCLCHPQKQRTFFFAGPLGAGKTTLIKSLLKALGVQDTVKSPSFALLHPHETPELTILHADCYRLNRPEEWLHLGIDTYLCQQKNTLWCIEWPSRASLTEADAYYDLDYLGTDMRRLEVRSPNPDFCAIKPHGTAHTPRQAD